MFKCLLKFKCYIFLFAHKDQPPVYVTLWFDNDYFYIQNSVILVIFDLRNMRFLIYLLIETMFLALIFLQDPRIIIEKYFFHLNPGLCNNSCWFKKVQLQYLPFDFSDFYWLFIHSLLLPKSIDFIFKTEMSPLSTILKTQPSQ